MTHDRHSYAEPALVRTTHLELDIALDFDEKVLAGSATHTRVDRHRGAQR